MEISPRLLQAFPELNEQQRQIIAHKEGRLLVIAGPGSGKTLSLILRVLNLLLLNLARPIEIILCTFTEKAAHELKARLVTLAARLDYQEDLSLLRVHTIHGICNQILLEYRHATGLGNDYEILDEFAQRLFLFKHRERIWERAGPTLFQGRTLPLWAETTQLQQLFNKITEELISPEKLTGAKELHYRYLAKAYRNYEQILQEENKVCFAILQKWVYKLLHSAYGERITDGIRYVCVDEYQDTNAIQEHILLRLTRSTQNLCVIGDEDQALYRFRGATVGNLLGFQEHQPTPTMIELTTNYRSHPEIIQAYDDWMSRHNWENEGIHYRFAKKIQAFEDPPHKKYPAVFGVQGRDQQEEAEQLAELILMLKEDGQITDYSEVALLFYSVRKSYTEPYIEALCEKAIPSYCPRARAYFTFPEIQLLISCFASILNYQEEKLTKLMDDEDNDAFIKYIQECKNLYPIDYMTYPEICAQIQQFQQEIEKYQQKIEEPVQRLCDFFYRLLAAEPFLSWLQNDEKARNLAKFTKELKHFQQISTHTIVTLKNRESLKMQLFATFLCLLHKMGLNEFEDDKEPFRAGHVQILTIHQAKGLEFPVVIIAELRLTMQNAQEDLVLSSYGKRRGIEPAKLMGGFDQMRLYYVAFSRAEKLLVLAHHKAQVPPMFESMWKSIRRWPYVRDELHNMSRVKAKTPVIIKQAYSFTRDIKMYESCPRQYKLYCKFEFMPSQEGEVSRGLLIHQSLEELHRQVLEKGRESLNEQRLYEICKRTAHYLSKTRNEKIEEGLIERAFVQTQNYFRQNWRELSLVKAVEVDITHEKEGYIISGRVDLLMERDGKLLLMDFKTAPRPWHDPAILFEYERQLCLYAYALEKRDRKPIGGLYLYWTEEPVRADALMEIAYEPARIEATVRDFGKVVERIEAEEFEVKTPPEKHVCQTCDLKYVCQKDGTIDYNAQRDGTC
jgi:DNA helicase II / ATP-dependent DNA helicase PcrA